MYYCLQFDLVCDYDIYPTLGLVALNVGGPIGVYAFGWLNDRIGRKKSFFTCLSTLLVGSLLTAYAHKFWLWAFARIIVGLTIPAIYQIPFIICKSTFVLFVIMSNRRDGWTDLDKIQAGDRLLIHYKLVHFWAFFSSTGVSWTQLQIFCDSNDVHVLYAGFDLAGWSHLLTTRLENISLSYICPIHILLLILVRNARVTKVAADEREIRRS